MINTVWGIAHPCNAGYELLPRGTSVVVFSDKQHAINSGNLRHGTLLLEISTKNLQMTPAGQNKYQVHGAIPPRNVRRETSLQNEYECLQRYKRTTASYQSRRPRVHQDVNGNYYSSEEDAMDATDEADLMEYLMNH